MFCIVLLLYHMFLFLQVPESPSLCCQRSVLRSLSIEHLSELTQLLEDEETRGGHTVMRRSSFSCLDSEERDSNIEREHRVCGNTHKPHGENDCEFCEMSCYSSTCYSTSCYSTSCYSNSGYEGRARFCSRNRPSSVDSNWLSGSMVFSSQDEEEDEERDFESVPNPVQPDCQEAAEADGERRTGRLKKARRGEQVEPPEPAPSDKNCIGKLKHAPPLGFLSFIQWSKYSFIQKCMHNHHGLTYFRI